MLLDESSKVSYANSCMPPDVVALSRIDMVRTITRRLRMSIKLTFVEAENHESPANPIAEGGRHRWNLV